MKHSIFTFITLAAASAALLSCAKEADIQNRIEPEIKGITVNVIADSDSKTYVEDGTVPIVKWSAGDKILLIESMDGTVKGYGESAAATLNGDRACFSTTLSWEATGGSSYTYSAVYPADAFIPYSGKYYLYMPEVQTLNGNNLSPDSDILFSVVEDKGATRVSDAEDIMFSFRRLGTLVRLNLKGIAAGEKINQVVITAPNYIAGAIEYDPVTGSVDPSTAFLAAASNEITLNVDELTATGEDVVWFRVLAEGDWAIGDAVSFKVITDKNIYKKEIASLPGAMKFPAGGLTKFGVDLSASALVPYSLPFAEDFEGAIDDWTLIDSDGDGYNWDITDIYPNSGNYALSSESYSNYYGPLSPDNWAFTPQIQLTTDNYLSFYVRAVLTNYPAEHYAVYIAEGSPMGALTTLIAETEYPYGNYDENGPDGIYQRYIVKIPDEFENKKVCIGFRHFNCTDMFALNIDDVEVVEGRPQTGIDAEYEDYLGAWDNNGSKITVSQKVDGVSYSITGLTNQGSYPVEAVFEDGRLVVYEQLVASSGTTEVFLQGSDGYFPSYPDGSSVAILRAEYDKVNDQLSFTGMNSYIYYMFITYDSQTRSDYLYDEIPSVMVPFVAFNAQYGDYLGEWAVGNKQYTITSKVDGSSYYISGFTGQGTYEVEAMFEDGRLVLYDQIVSSSGTTDIGLVGLTDTYTFYGFPTSGARQLFVGEYDSVNDAINIIPSNNYVYYCFLTFENQSYSDNDAIVEIPSVLIPYVPVVDTNTYIYQEGFEAGEATGWTFFDADGDGNEWAVTGAEVMFSGNYSLWSRSWATNALTPDNYAFTPAITLTSNNYLSYWISADASWEEEHYAIYISTDAPSTSNPGTVLFEQTFNWGDTDDYFVGITGSHKHFVIPIPSAFENSTVYIGFRHFNCTDMNYLAIDDISIIEGTPVFTAPAKPWKVSKAMNKSGRQKKEIISVRPSLISIENGSQRIRK